MSIELTPRRTTKYYRGRAGVVDGYSDATEAEEGIGAFFANIELMNCSEAASIHSRPVKSE